MATRLVRKMTPEKDSLQQLVTEGLPLDLVGPHLRLSARKAVASGNPDRLRLVGRMIAGELLRKGELLRVAVESNGQPLGPFALLSRTRRLLDLSPLGGHGFAVSQINDGMLKPEPESANRREFTDFSGIVEAMDQAQDLEIGDPQSGEMGVILGGILRLLSRFTPQFRLAIMLHDKEAVPSEHEALFVPDQNDPNLRWLDFRRDGGSVWISQPQDMPGFLGTNSHDEEAEPLAVAMGVPLYFPDLQDMEDMEAAKSNEAGLFFLGSGSAWENAPMLRLAQRLSSFVTRRWQHQHTVNQRIHTDSLTGVYNRAYFDSQFTLELERSRRSQVPLTLIIGDLDHFKQINDSRGHTCGDQVLRMVARRLQEELRRIDHICRIGGEEFALILPDTAHGSAREVVTRLLNTGFSLAELEDEGAKPLKVTFSFGAVTCPEAGSDAFELYRKADAMLYLSKDLGRNQCHFWSSEGNHLQLKPGL